MLILRLGRRIFLILGNLFILALDIVTTKDIIYSNINIDKHAQSNKYLSKTTSLKWFALDILK